MAGVAVPSWSHHLTEVTPVQIKQISNILDFVLAHPDLIGFVALILGFVFVAYLFVRRTLTGLREGFDDGYKGK